MKRQTFSVLLQNATISLVHTKKLWKSCDGAVNLMILLTISPGTYRPFFSFILLCNSNLLSRNRETLNANTLHRYSRLCNILLKQGRISPELREKTISLLGSDADKEAFFKEFEMTDQLRSFYESKGRWFELYELTVFAGDLFSAMNILLTHKLLPVVDKKIIETLFQYAVTELFFVQRGFVQGKPEGHADLLKASKSTWLERIAQKWQMAFELIKSFEDENAPTSVKELEEGLLKDFFCLFVRTSVRVYCARRVLTMFR